MVFLGNKAGSISYHPHPFCRFVAVSSLPGLSSREMAVIVWATALCRRPRFDPVSLSVRLKRRVYLPPGKTDTDQQISGGTLLTPLLLVIHQLPAAGAAGGLQVVGWVVHRQKTLFDH